MRMTVSAGLFLLLIPGASAANFQVANDRVYTFPVTGPTGPWPAGTNLTATSSLPNSLVASIGGSNSAVTLTLQPKVQTSPGITVTISGNGAITDTFLVDVGADPIPPIQIGINQAGATNVLQPVPIAPGP